MFSGEMVGRRVRRAVGGLLALAVLGVSGCAAHASVAQPQDGGSTSGSSLSRSGSTFTPAPAATVTGTPSPSPSPRTSTPTTSPSASPSRSASPTALRYVFPVRSTAAHFGRFHHDYPATDIFAPCGSPAVAPVAGVVSEVSRQDDWSPRTNLGADRGGLSISIVGLDGVRYYGSHLRSVAASIAPGRRVSAGQLLGQVGDTGDARGIACHLHFGISPACGRGDWWVRRGVVSPYPFLLAWRAGSNSSPGRTVAAWHTERGCPRAASTDP